MYGLASLLFYSKFSIAFLPIQNLGRICTTYIIEHPQHIIVGFRKQFVF